METQRNGYTQRHIGEAITLNSAPELVKYLHIWLYRREENIEHFFLGVGSMMWPNHFYIPFPHRTRNYMSIGASLVEDID